MPIQADNQLNIPYYSPTNAQKAGPRRTYLVDAVRIPRSLEMVFKPQRDSLYHSLKRVQSLSGRPIDLPM